MDLQLQDKVIFVAGASRGIGRGIVETLLAEGARVAIFDGLVADDVTLALAGGIDILHKLAMGLLGKHAAEQIAQRRALGAQRIAAGVVELGFGRLGGRENPTP